MESPIIGQVLECESDSAGHTLENAVSSAEHFIPTFAMLAQMHQRSDHCALKQTAEGEWLTGSLQVIRSSGL
jgi:hypothetical protein